MAKRDHDTEIWNEDWFLNLSSTEMLFWFYIKDRCDHAGFWRPNFKMFENITGKRINSGTFLEKINSDIERIKVLENGRWLITGFIPFQYGSKLNLKNHFHRSIYNTFTNNLPNEKSIDYKFEVLDTSKTPQGEVNKEQELRNNILSNIKNNSLKDTVSIKPKDEKYNPETDCPFWNDPDFKDAFQSWQVVRVKKRCANTDRAYKAITKKIMEYSGGKKEIAIKILDKSSFKGYTDLYPLEEGLVTQKPEDESKRAAHMKEIFSK